MERVKQTRFKMIQNHPKYNPGHSIYSSRASCDETHRLRPLLNRDKMIDYLNSNYLICPVMYSSLGQYLNYHRETPFNKYRNNNMK